MTPVRIRWTEASPVDGEVSHHEAAHADWLEAAQAIAQIQLYEGLTLAAVITADLEGFRSYAAHLAPYGVRWEPHVEVAMAA